MTTPTIATTDEAVRLLESLAADYDQVSVFWDRGWGDNNQPAEISIIVDGDGQNPKAHITADVYRALCDAGTVGENTLMTYKARRVHDYKTPPVAEGTGPSANDVAEEVIRRLFDTMPDRPLYAEFYRGVERGRYGPEVRNEAIATPVCGRSWFVRLLPGCSDVAISAAGEYSFGHADTIEVTCLEYPRRNGEVDLVELANDGFADELRVAVEAKLALVAVDAR